MGRSSRSTSSHCLFCFKSWEKETSFIDGGIVGAGRFGTILQKQLQNYFVVRHLLDMPNSWCEERLVKNDGYSHPSAWFRLCDDCLGVVSDAWKVQQKILRLESRMKSIKTAIMEDIERSIKKFKSKLQPGSMGAEEEIRAFLYPSLMGKRLQASKVGLNDEAGIVDLVDDENSGSGFADDFFLDEFTGDLTDHESNTEKKRGRRRGRKRKKGEKRVSKTEPSFHWHMCQQCPSRYSTVEEFQSHLNAHAESEKTGGIYDCKICSFPARSSGELEIHKNHKHAENKEKTKNYPCSQCDFKSITWKTLKSHVLSEHPDVAQEEAGEWDLKCSVCGKVCETRSTLIVHQKKMHASELFGASEGTFQCEHCSIIFPDQIRLNYHIRSEHFRINRYVCDVCGKGFRFIKSMERHKITHDKGKRDYVCHICGCDYSYSSILVEHYKKVHPQVNNMEGDEKVEERSQVEYGCRYCELKTPYKTVLIRHMQVHKAEMGYHCDVPGCDRSYTSAQGLKRHKAINHQGPESTVQCKFCMKRFPHVEYMNTHMRLYCKMKTIKEKELDPSPTNPETPTSNVGEESAKGPTIASTCSIVQGFLDNAGFVQQAQNPQTIQQPTIIYQSFPPNVKVDIEDA